MRSLVNGEEITAFTKLIKGITTSSPVHLFPIRGRQKIALGTRLDRLEISSFHLQINEFYLKILINMVKVIHIHFLTLLIVALSISDFLGKSELNRTETN